MPELPEIEVIRRSLEPALVGTTLRVAWIGPHDMRARGKGRGRSTLWAAPKDLLDSKRVRALHRHGKQLAIECDDGAVLVVQLGMSGQLLLQRAPRAVATGARAVARTSRSTHTAHDPHSHIEWTVERRGRAWLLTFRDPRRFGGVHWAASMQALRNGAWKSLGPDALGITARQLSAALHGTRQIKAALLDQHLIAGVGNIYADEALFRARIAPTARLNRFDRHASERLASALTKVLARAVQSNGSTLRDYRTATGEVGRAQLTHAVYGRAKKPCIECGAPLHAARIAARATVWCSSCQERLLSKASSRARRARFAVLSAPAQRPQTRT